MKVEKITIKEGPFKIGEIKHGEMQQWRGAFWYLGCPRCGEPLKLNHDVTINDGLVTLSPSLGCPWCRFHAWVKDGNIEQLGDY